MPTKLVAVMIAEVVSAVCWSRFCFARASLTARWMSPITTKPSTVKITSVAASRNINPAAAVTTVGRTRGPAGAGTMLCIKPPLDEIENWNNVPPRARRVEDQRVQRSFSQLRQYRARRSRMRVLVVEDEPRLAAGVRDGLEAEGFAVDVAADGTDGLWLARERPYDAIVL